MKLLTLVTLFYLTCISAFSQGARVVKPTGKYYALLIAVSNYDNYKLNLDGPIKDATELQSVLESRYEFDKGDITRVFNPSRDQIMDALFGLRKKLTPNDNLLIFYAGHGYWDKDNEQGYWWPKDVNPESPSKWISNSDVREQIKGINTAHTLLISDACFGGSIFRSAEAIRNASLDIAGLYKLPSRRAITSGAKSEPVPDNSVFLRYLIKRLSQNEEPFLSSDVLYSSFRQAVVGNGGTVPQAGVIDKAGDEGGDFIFIKKGASTNLLTATVPAIVNSTEVSSTIRVSEVKTVNTDIEDAPAHVYDMLKSPSRKAMTSGILSDVPNESIFMKYLVQGLVENKNKYFSSEDLFSYLTPIVLNNSDVTPRYGEIRNVGDENGSFVFIRGEKNPRFHALIIAVERYEDGQLHSLDNPVKDASSLNAVLLKDYGFEEKNVSFLRNPGYDEIYLAFENLAHTISTDDFLIVFFAGHGTWDKAMEQSYWLPKNARTIYKKNWFSSTILIDEIKAIRSKHTLLISDAPFGGSIFKSR